MSVKIRLRRDGAKKRPFYHVVAADERRARNGRYIEELGYYNPIVAADAEPILVLKEERIRYWLGVGAQPSPTAAALLKKQGILARTVPGVKKGAPTAAATAPAADTTQTAPAETSVDAPAAVTAADAETDAEATATLGAE